LKISASEIDVFSIVMVVASLIVLVSYFKGHYHKSEVKEIPVNDGVSW
tara:strand:- start:155 stop:298 length:144 start_codon:yes stop_codon:yes gene_type:complete